MTTAAIPSRTSSATYTVTLDDAGATSCTCRAGVHGKPCWHARAVAAEATRRAAWRLVDLRTGRALSSHATAAEAEAAQHRVHAAGGWCAVEQA